MLLYIFEAKKGCKKKCLNKLPLAADLLKPILDLNCQLLIEHVSSDCVWSDDDPLALALFSASHILFASNCVAPLLIGQVLCSLFPGLSWNSEALRVSL